MFSIGFMANTGRKTVISAFIGFAVGFITASYLFLQNSPFDSELHGELKWFKMDHRQAGPNVSMLEGEVTQHYQNEDYHRGDDLVAKQLEKEVRVLCWVTTTPASYQTKARHVLATWGRRCNTMLFMSTANDSSLPVVALDVPEGYDMLWGKTKAAFLYVHEYHSQDYDWVLKADDDTYVIVENLRYMLYHYNNSEPLYFGCRFKPFVKQGFMSGGAGYVLSKEAVARFVTQAMPDKTKCNPGNSGKEDVEIGKCLENVGVVAMDSRDQYKRGRFFPFPPKENMFPPWKDPQFWFWSHTYYNTSVGMNCCSDLAITFHYIKPEDMYVMEYMIYHLRPFGIKHHNSLGIPTHRLVH